MKNISLVEKIEDKNAVDLGFRQYDSVSVSPEKYDPNIPLEVKYLPK